MRLVKRIGPLVLATAALGTTAYVVASRFKTQPLSESPPVVPPRDSFAVGPVAPPIAPPSSAGPSSSAPPERTPTPITTLGHAKDPTSPSASAKGAMRTVAIGSIQPTFGVLLSIDGAPPGEVTPNYTFEANDKPHTLVFTCRDDLCEPKTVSVPEGEGPEALGTVQLAVRPGHLVVEGEATHSYSVEEIPGLLVSPGTARDIPMGASGSRTITVYDTQDPTKRRTVKMVANKQAFVSFVK